MRRSQRQMQHRVRQGKAASGSSPFPPKTTSWALSKLVTAFIIGVAALAIAATMFESAQGIIEAQLSVTIGNPIYPVAFA